MLCCQILLFCYLLSAITHLIEAPFAFVLQPEAKKALSSSSNCFQPIRILPPKFGRAVQNSKQYGQDLPL